MRITWNFVPNCIWAEPWVSWESVPRGEISWEKTVSCSGRTNCIQIWYPFPYLKFFSVSAITVANLFISTTSNSHKKEFNIRTFIYLFIFRERFTTIVPHVYRTAQTPTNNKAQYTSTLSQHHNLFFVLFPSNLSVEYRTTDSKRTQFCSGFEPVPNQVCIYFILFIQIQFTSPVI